MRYEEFKQTSARVQSGLREFLLEKALSNELVAHSLHWYLELERNNSDNAEEMRAYYQQIYD